MEKREALKVWTILLAILAFSLSLIGTFLVRSGVLTSVHAFAVDPRRGVFILAILVTSFVHAIASAARPRLRMAKSSPALPGLDARTTLSVTRTVHRLPGVGGATSDRYGLPPITRSTLTSVPCPLPRRIETGACVDCFPIPRGLPRFSAGSASATSLSRPAQASLALRPTGSLNRPRRPLSQGSGPSGCPNEPLASYQINRQLSGWNLPPLVLRAVGAH
jgi:hypothetical protein